MKRYALTIGLVLGLAHIAVPAFAKGQGEITVRQAKKQIAAECNSYGGGVFHAKYASLGYLTRGMSLKTALSKGPISWDLRSGKADGFLGLRGSLSLNGKSLVVSLERGANGGVIEDHFTNHK
jgi:hypothetical protein